MGVELVDKVHIQVEAAHQVFVGGGLELHLEARVKSPDHDILLYLKVIKVNTWREMPIDEQR